MRIKLFNIFLMFFIFQSKTISGALIRPLDNSQLNYIHVLFEWEQVPDAAEYAMQISNDEGFNNIVSEASVNSLIYIEEDNIEWSEVDLLKEYFWRIKPVYDNGIHGEWSGYNRFSTNIKLSEATAETYNNQGYNEGLTIFGSFYNYYSAIIDKDGREIWNTADKDIVYYNSNKYLDLLGCYSESSFENNLPGIEFSIDSERLWEEPNNEFLHHDLVKLPNGNYLGIVSTTQLGPIPIGSWSASYQGIGFLANGITPEFPWVGDRIVEWDKDTKEEVWSWSTFDYFSMQDFDALGGCWLPSATGYQEYDWTHVNAVIFSESENAIYISTRHLSRITKIDYPSGNIVWNIGRSMPSGDVTIGNDLGFSFQHGLQKLDNGNIVTLDNGNLSETFLGTDHPITRAIEISVNNNQTDIVWEYSLAPNLFGFASGNAQKLDNGNYLITTIGQNGTSLEVSGDGEIIWQGNYNLCEPICAVYRAHRIPSLYPIAFSVIVENLSAGNDGSENVYLEEGNSQISFKIKNEGSVSETYSYNFVEDLDWFENFSGEINLDPGAEYILSFDGVTVESSIENEFVFNLSPVHKPSLEKNISHSLSIGTLAIKNNRFLPANFHLYDPYPNPFNSIVKLKLTKEPSDLSRLDIYNINGSIIDQIDISSKAGTFEVSWNAQNFPSGIYFIKLSDNSFNQTKKIIYLK